MPTRPVADGRNPGRVGDRVLEAVGKLITRILMPRGVYIVIVDLSSTASASCSVMSLPNEGCAANPVSPGRGRTP
ncbi:hypothetical protein [Acidilobus sp.]|uniref:hypothetical protein n=1 Tax=Acidilobus sp. TaxID=1872109 RepID=UPI003D0490C8